MERLHRGGSPFMGEGPPSLLELPCRFPIKVMADAGGSVVAAVEAAVARHVRGDGGSVEITQRASRTGRYVGITVVVTATSQAQLDALYSELGRCSGVRMVL